MKQLDLLADRGVLAPIDAKFGGFLVRHAPMELAPDDRDVIGVAGALLSADRARGHSCVDLAALAGVRPWGSEAAIAPFPAVDAACSILERSALCGDGVEPTALVLDGTRLYLYRYHAAERRLAAAVRARVHDGGAASEADAATVALFRTLFPAPTDGSADWQAVAAAAALRSRLCIITGGPGTGKTTTTAKLLALLLQRDPSLRVALAAPTGKAAARLAEAIATGAASLDIPDDLRARLPRDGRTLHRLLGYRPWDDRFACDAANPLTEDVIVVDEASMVDLLMMDALFAAIRPGARVILLGDPDQLASVEAGYVLGDLCRAGDASGAEHGRAFAEWYATLSGQAIPSSATATPMRDAVVRLQRSYRFEAHPGIGTLASAVRGGDSDRALAILDGDAHGDVSRRDAVHSTDELLEPLAPFIEAHLNATTPAEALHALAAFRVLCAVRDGRTGVAGVTDAIEWWLRGRGVHTRARWYDGRPILVTANDPATGLYNGDVGVVFTDADGRKLVYFPDGADGVRAVSPARLPEHETAWAMTVHKSQGSEFTHVVLVLPGEDTPVLTRELLYTAITRARESVRIVGSAEVIATAARRSTVRASGLADRVVAREI